MNSNAIGALEKGCVMYHAQGLTQHTNIPTSSPNLTHTPSPGDTDCVQAKPCSMIQHTPLNEDISD